MKQIERLTSKERLFAEEHHDLVCHFLSHYGLEESEYYDVVIWGYLAAVQEYLRKSKLQHYAFSTIAWRQMRDAYIQNTISRNRLKSKAVTVSYQEESPLMELDYFLPDRTLALEEQMLDQEIVLELLSHLTPKEKEVVMLKADGYTYAEIAERCRISIYGVQSRINRFRSRLQNTPYIPHRGDLV